MEHQIEAWPALWASLKSPLKKPYVQKMLSPLYAIYCHLCVTVDGVSIGE
jgi:hypothetical protein